MIFGYRVYRLGGEGLDRVIRKLPGEGIMFCALRKRGDTARIKVAAEDCAAFEELCRSCKADAVSQYESTIAWLIHTLISRKGFAAGILICVCLGVYLSNRVARFEILDDDPEIKSAVMAVLKEEGIGTGTFIPSIDIVKTERALKQRVEGISWAGITRKGNSLIIDVIEADVQMKHERDVYPSSLVACENGVIETIEIQDGQVRIPVGSGVSKGDTVVSGEIVTNTSTWIDGRENIDTEITYARSRGKVLGTFERTLTFTQPLTAQTQVFSPGSETKRFFCFFDARLPLFFSVPEGNFEVNERKTAIEFLGLPLPIGIESDELMPYKTEDTQLTPEQALALAYEKEKDYEKNFLGGYEIRNVSLSQKTDADSVTVTAEYTLYGELCREVSFFVPKDKFGRELFKKEEEKSQ